MFTPNYVTEGIKTKEDAFQHILECILESPGCVGNDGSLSIQAFGEFIVLKPKKKKHIEYAS